SRSVGTETYREKRLLYSGLTKTSTALPRLSSKRTIL
ncbi:branched-chain amino acid permease, partial [Neisseria meningitidis]